MATCCLGWTTRSSVAGDRRSAPEVFIAIPCGLLEAILLRHLGSAGFEETRTHQSLHHLVADAPWNDEQMLAQVRRDVLPTMQKHGPVVAWIVDDTGFPKQGKHSAGVAR